MGTGGRGNARRTRKVVGRCVQRHQPPTGVGDGARENYRVALVAEVRHNVLIRMVYAVLTGAHIDSYHDVLPLCRSIIICSPNIIALPSRRRRRQDNLIT